MYLIKVYIRVNTSHSYGDASKLVTVTLEVRDVIARLKNDSTPLWRVMRTHTRAIDRLLAACGFDGCEEEERRSRMLTQAVREAHRAALVPMVLPPRLDSSYNADMYVNDERIQERMWDIQNLVCGGDPIAARMFLERMSANETDLGLM